MTSAVPGWLFWAILFAIFAKIGLAEIDSDLATFIRTAIILIMVGLLLAATRKLVAPMETPKRSWLFLLLSGLATDASWLCYNREPFLTARRESNCEI